MGNCLLPRNGGFQNNGCDSLQKATVGWRFPVFLEQPVYDLCANIRIQRTFSLAQKITGKPERIPERGEQQGVGLDNTALVGRRTPGPAPAQGLKLHIYNLALYME